MKSVSATGLAKRNNPNQFDPEDCIDNAYARRRGDLLHAKHEQEVEQYMRGPKPSAMEVFLFEELPALFAVLMIIIVLVGLVFGK